MVTTIFKFYLKYSTTINNDNSYNYKYNIKISDKTQIDIYRIILKPGDKGKSPKFVLEK